MSGGAGAGPQSVLISALAPEPNHAAFSCGIPALDRYLQSQAGHDVAKRVAATLVLTALPVPAVQGFYTLATASVRVAKFPPAMARHLLKYPFGPATLLGHLAVEAGVRRLRCGTLLLLDACWRSLLATRAVTSAAVLADAKNATVVSLYAACGFLRLIEQPCRLFLPMRSVEALGGVTP